MISEHNDLQLELDIKSTSSGQKIEDSGRIHVPKKAWILRLLIISLVLIVIIYNLFVGIKFLDPLILFSTFMPIEAVIVAIVGWFFYRNPTGAKIGNALVSILIPVYNQKDMISLVVDAIAHSTYQNIEIIAVNDGSTDGTKEVLDNLKRKYPKLQVFHKKNSGKRSTNYVGFSKAKGDFICFIDSDSIIDQFAIEEFMKSFSTDPRIGAVVGHAKVWNAKKSFITKLQDSWYDFQFNVVKCSESTLENVMCCSGCLAAYRREAIEKFVPLWSESSTKNPDTKIQESSYFQSNPWINKKFTKTSKNILEWASKFDDGEDSVLTSQTLVDWKALYVSTAKVYTDVPENLRGFLKQQIRWKKGWFRAALFLMTYFWRKNPILSTVFYINLITAFSAPLIMIIVFFYAPFVLHQYWIPPIFLGGITLIGVGQGLDYKFRDPTSRNWKYRPITNLMTGFLLPWLMIPAMLSIKKSQWLTR